MPRSEVSMTLQPRSAKVPWPIQPPAGLTPVADAEAWAAITTHAALVFLPGPAAIEISGRDAADYLHRRLAQSVKKLPVGRGVHALQLSGEGRMECDLLLYRSGETRFTALADAALADSAAAILDKYVLMDEVEIAGPSGERATLTLLGPRSTEVAGEVFGAEARGSLEADRWSTLTDAQFRGRPVSIFSDGRGSIAILHLCVRQADADAVVSAIAGVLKASGGAVAGPEAAEYARIAAGIARFGADTDGATIPLEANLRDAIDLNKGCFPGQEFLARINNLGHPAKVLARLRFDATTAPAVGDAVRDPAAEAQGEGRVTSARKLEGVAEGLGLAVLPWKLRHLREVVVPGGGRSVNAAVELLGEYPDASDARRTI